MADAVFEEAEAPAPAPQSGKAAVNRAVAVDELRGGNLQVGTQTSKVVGSHTYYLVDETWTRDDYEEGADAPGVEVGSPSFSSPGAEAPEITDAARLGTSVVTEGPDA